MHLHKFLIPQLFAPSFTQAQTGSTLLPVVDLGYELYRASNLDVRSALSVSSYQRHLLTVFLTGQRLLPLLQHPLRETSAR